MILKTTLPKKTKYQAALAANKSINYQEYFEDVIGVTVPEKNKIISIQLLFTPTEAPYILTKPIHGSQKKKELNKKGLLISVDLIPNIEFEKLILSFGENVKVISPKSFSNKIKNRIEKMRGQY
ncbi:MAG: WYL domain-containing protein [Bacteroidetes bacterium]|nr:WYL domain-containing protein [Bacteroidota bacterium]